MEILWNFAPPPPTSLPPRIPDRFRLSHLKQKTVTAECEESYYTLPVEKNSCLRKFRICIIAGVVLLAATVLFLSVGLPVVMRTLQTQGNLILLIIHFKKHNLFSLCLCLNLK